MKRGARKAHHKIWTVFGIALPAIFLAGLYLKQSIPQDRPAILLEAPKEN